MSIMTDQIPVLDTPRLTLRAPKMADLPTLTAFFATTRSHLVGGPTDEIGAFTKLTQRIGHWALLGYGYWHIDSRENGDFLGWVGIANPPTWDEPELGWTLFAHAEGKGIAFEAASAARAFSAIHLGLDRVISYVAADNDRSAALARRLDAHLETQCIRKGRDVHIYRHPSQVEAP